MTAPIAAVVVAFNSRDHIDALLDSLPEAFGTLAYEVVVVDNGSSDGTADHVAARDTVRLVRSTNTGFAGGINTGVQQATATGPILILNPDATLAAGSVPVMLEVLAKPSVGIVAPRMLEADGSLSPSLRREPTLLRVAGLSFTGQPALTERIEETDAYLTEHPVDWAVGAVLLIDRDCYDTLGGFDESFFLYSEETDFSLRARDQGWLTVYTPSAEVTHVGGGSGESELTHTMKAVNRVRLFGRRNGRLRTGLYYLLVILTELRRGLLGHSWSWHTVTALLVPARRPAQLGAGDMLIPR